MSQKNRSSKGYKTLESKIENMEAHIGVIGLGYVGLPLAFDFAKKGFKVTGFDVDKKKVEMINQGCSYIQDITSEELEEVVPSNKNKLAKQSGQLKATDNFSSLGKIDAISICVPTPLGKTKDPDVSYIMQATEKIKKYLRKGQIIILESTTYPGTTRELILPELEETGLRVGKDIFLAFSPERIDPGNKDYGLTNTPKVVGGVTSHCTDIVKLLYSQVIDNVICVKSADAAEMVKLLENTFRSVNIALVNEMAIMCNVLGVDVWDVIEAAGSKPFGFMKFYPGPGLGGHCIPIDPHYLSWKLKILNYRARFIELASEINTRMPNLVVEKVAEGLNQKGKSIMNSKILILGVAYKEDIDDVRESPALDVIRLLQAKGAKVSYHDPYVSSLQADKHSLKSQKLTRNTLEKTDCTVLITSHSCFDPEFIVRHSDLVVDFRNITEAIVSPKIIRL